MTTNNPGQGSMDAFLHRNTPSNAGSNPHSTLRARSDQHPSQTLVPSMTTAFCSPSPTKRVCKEDESDSKSEPESEDEEEKKMTTKILTPWTSNLPNTSPRCKPSAMKVETPTVLPPPPPTPRWQPHSAQNTLHFMPTSKLSPVVS